MNYREEIVSKYINDMGLPNSKIINYKDSNYYDFYHLDEIKEGVSLADSAFFDENKKLTYGFLKNFDGEEMRLITGYTGSGKSMRYLLQQLFTSIKRGNSAVVTDMSGQLIEYSYNFLKANGVNVKVLNISNPNATDTFNPLYLVAKDCYEKKQITTVAESYLKELSEIIIHCRSKQDPIWEKGAQSLVKGILMGMFEAMLDGQISYEDITIHNMVAQYYWLKREVSKSQNVVNLSQMRYYSSIEPTNRSVQLLSGVVENSDKTRACYFGVANDNILELNNRTFDLLTSSNTIDIDDLWNKQTVLFVNTGGKTSGNLISSLLLNQIYDEILLKSQKEINKKLPRPVQFFLDEFTNISFGDPQKIETMITTTRKHQVFFNMFIQSYSQLITKFGEAITTTIRSNSTEVFLGSKDYYTRNEFAASCGRKTIETIDSIFNNREPRLTQINLITPEMLLKIPKGQMYIIRNGYDLINTYYEAVFMCDEFKPSLDYENEYLNEQSKRRINTITQFDMKRSIETASDIRTPADFSNLFSYREAVAYVKLYDKPQSINSANKDQIMNKLVKYKAITVDDTGTYKPTISIDIVKSFIDNHHNNDFF